MKILSKRLTLNYIFVNIIYEMSKDVIKGGNKMKSTGVVRRVDELGRIVIPIELRRTLDIADKDALEIYVDGEQIILKEI